MLMDFEEDLFENPDVNIVNENADEQEEEEETNNDAEEDTEAREGNSGQAGGTKKKVPPKKRTGPTHRLTLDHTRLCGERGLPILPKHFENVKFKGKGHEKEDLSTLMFHLEHWGHRLFPRLTFDDFLERVEWLGSKKPVKNCVTKIRLGMPILSEDFVSKDVTAEDDAENSVGITIPDGEDAQHPTQEEQDDIFEQMMQEYESSRNAKSAELAEDMDATVIDNEREQTANKKAPLSPSILEKIERNKRLAEERRRARMQQATQSMVLTHTNDTSHDTSESVDSENTCCPTREELVLDTTDCAKDGSEVPHEEIPEAEADGDNEILTEDALLAELENEI